MANSGVAFQGSNLWGTGFTLEPETAADLIRLDSRNRDVLFPYLSGRDVNEHPQHQPARWVINFFEWPRERAESYSDCFRIVEEEVKPGRMNIKRTRNRERWWIFGETRPGLYGAIKGADVVPVTVLHSPYGLPAMVSAQQVFSHGLAVFANSDWSHFGVLSSAVHTAWAVNRGSTLETRIRYTPTDVYETFPMPHYANANVKLQFGELARRLHNHRASLMTRSGLGLTKMYNKFHDPVENDPDIKSLRGLHIELDTVSATPTAGPTSTRITITGKRRRGFDSQSA
ncbi:MAG: type IIL restriction-modification enzyme MmeI [Acidimicrobiales bacterium]